MGKRILIHDYAGHPFQMQLSRELARRGHEVLHLYFAKNNTPKGNLDKKGSDPSTLTIRGVSTKEPIKKYSYIKRWLQDNEYGSLIAEEIKSFRPDYLLSANTPLDTLRIILRTCNKVDTKFIFWVQDVSGLAAKKLLSKKIPVIGSLIGEYHIQLERYILRNSFQVVLISEDFKPIVQGWQVDSQKLKVIPNWAPLDELPVREKNNAWASQFGVADKFCFLYTGGLGLKQNPDMLLQLALHFKDNPNVCVLVVSEGPGGGWLKEKAAKLGLENLQVLDYQPYNQLPDVMASADVLLTTQTPDAGTFCVPSKVLSYLCAGRPQLMAIPLNNLAAKIVVENSAGIAVPSDDVNGFIISSEKLLHDETLRNDYSKNARKYAEKTFSLANITDQFEVLFR